MNKNRFFEQLIHSLQTIYPLTREDIAPLLNEISVKNLNKGELFLQQGKKVRTIAYSAMIEDRPSYFSIDALEDAAIIIIPFDSIKSLVKTNLNWAQFLIRILEHAFMKKEEREREFLLEDAITRYQKFKTDYPGLENRLKQYHIASYLGITPVALSRIKKEYSINLG